VHERPAEWRIRIASHNVEDALVLRVVGRIELGSASRLHDAIGANLELPAPGPIVVDLEGVTFLGTVGLAMLTELATETARSGRQLRIVVAANSLVSMPLELSGVDTRLTLYPSVEAALDAP
jgi:anti-sigma B factor antagonist